MYCILLTTRAVLTIFFFKKEPDMKFIILVSNLKEILPSVFSWKKQIYRKKTTMQFCQNTIQPKKKNIYYAYVLKNGVGRFNIFFYFLHKSCRILLCRFRVESVNIFIYNMCFFQQAYFAHAQTLYRMRSLCRSSMVIWSYSWIYEYHTGKHWILYGR